jgi:hypothetical protein
VTNDSAWFCPETGYTLEYMNKTIGRKYLKIVDENICACLGECLMDEPAVGINRTSCILLDQTNKTALFHGIEELANKTYRPITTEDVFRVERTELPCDYHYSIDLTNGSISDDGVILFHGNYFLPTQYAAVTSKLKYEEYGFYYTVQLYIPRWREVARYVRGCISNVPKMVDAVEGNYTVIRVNRDSCLESWEKSGDVEFHTVN